MVTKLTNSNYERIQEFKFGQHFKTKLKLWQNSNCDKTQIATKPKLWQNYTCDETQNMTKLTKLKNQIVIKLKNSICDKTQIVTKLEL